MSVCVPKGIPDSIGQFPLNLAAAAGVHTAASSKDSACIIAAVEELNERHRYVLLS